MKIKKYVLRTIITFGILGYVFFSLIGCTIKELDIPEVTALAPSLFVQTDYFVTDNTTPLTNLLTDTYALSDLENFFGKHSSQGAGILSEMGVVKNHLWNDVNSSFPVQCTRYNNNVHYSVYKVKEGGYYYVFWSVPIADGVLSASIEQATEINVHSSVYLDKLPSFALFKSIIKNYSTAQDILAIDPHLELNFMSSLVSSYSLLNDGRIIIIRYSHESLRNLEDLVVQDIYVCAKNSVNSKISAILTKDLPQNQH